MAISALLSSEASGASASAKASSSTTACFTAAGQAGDLRPETGDASNAFWFAYHVAAMTAFGRLSGRDAYPYEGGREEVVADLARFILRGIGLTDAAMAANFDVAALRRPAAPAAA